MAFILITGAAKGIGRACALHLARAGHQIFAGVRNSADGESLRRASSNITPVQLEVTNQEQIKAAAGLIEQRVAGQGLYGLINNAGIAVACPLEFLPVDELRRQLEVNVIGQIAVTQAVLPMIRRAVGRIVNIGSIAGRNALPLTGAYAASKFALEALTDALRVELMPWGLHVVIIEPGVIATPIWETSAAAADRLLQRLPPAIFEYYGAVIDALRRRAQGGTSHGLQPDLVARVVEQALFAKRPKTRYLVGRDARMRVLFQWLPDRVRDRIIAQRLARMSEDVSV